MLREQTLSDLLKTIRDQFRGHEIADQQMLVAGEALSALVETIDHAREAAQRLEAELEEHRRRAGGGNVVGFPRRRHMDDRPRCRAWRHSPWHTDPASISGAVMDDDDGGSAA